jgi:putative hydrolase of the HAD superfamily
MFEPKLQLPTASLRWRRIRSACRLSSNVVAVKTYPMKIFFDVDGVLIDGWHADPSLRKPWDASIDVDLGVNREAFERLFFGAPGARSSSPMFECVTGRRDLKAALADILPQVGYEGTVDDFVRYWFDKDSNVNGAVLELIRQLRNQENVQTFIATGQEHHRAAYLWNSLAFSKDFDRMFYSAEIGLAKKEIGFFEAINRSLGIRSGERPLFFDDQPEIVELAKQVGWEGMLFRSVEDIEDHPRLRGLLSARDSRCE